MGTPQRRRNSVDVPRRLPTCASVGRGEDSVFGRPAATGGTKWKEEETVKTLRPTVWLTEDFPLSVDEFLPLLDILATRVRAVRRLRELLTTKFPPGTFPVKVTFSDCLLPCSSNNASSCTLYSETRSSVSLAMQI
jgi:hypothetical protein